jgi:hypothetical protein
VEAVGWFRNAVCWSSRAHWLGGLAGTVHRGRRQGRLGELGAQFTARGAVHPMQALHNFAVGVVAARMTRVVIARGMDPVFGYLHDGRKPGRLSLTWDCIEPLRPGLVTAVFRFAEGRTFKKSEFRVVEGVVRLVPRMAMEMTAVALDTVSIAKCLGVVRMVERVMR